MIYELQIIEDLIVSVKTERQFDQNLFDKSLNQIDEETGRIKKVFRHKVFGFEKEKYAERYIQQHQAYLIRLADELLHHLPESPVDPIPSTEWPLQVRLLQHLYSAIEHLLTYIETYFSKYFSLDEKIPESYGQIARRDMAEDEAMLKQELTKNSLDARLTSLILTPLHSFAFNTSREPVTFRRLIYLKEFKKELMEVIHSVQNPARLEQDIFTSMTYLNFNSARFTEYCTMRINDTYSSKSTLAAQIETLAYFLKRVNQVQEKPGFAYIPKLKSLREQITDWITEEIFFLEKKRQLSLNLSLQKAESDLDNFKLHTEMSVPQVAYLVRLFLETGIIKNKNIMDVIRFFAKHIQTKKTETISVESFRSKFYNADSSAREVIKDLLIKLLNHARKPG